MKHFTREELRQELAECIAIVLTRTKHIFGYDAAENLLPGVKSDTFRVLHESIHVDGLPITYQFLKLYDYVIGNEWDWLGRHHNPDDFYQDTKCFIEWINAIEEFGNDCPSTHFCNYLVKVAFARMSFDEELDFGLAHDLSMEEVALLANMEVSSVRNAAAKGEFLTYVVEGERYPDSKDLKRWLPERRGFRQSKIFDSIADIDFRQLSTFDKLSIFIMERCNQIGSSPSDFINEIGWSPDRFLGVEQFSTGDLKHFDPEEWIKVAKFLKIERLWLIARVMKLFVFSLDYTFQWGVLWDLWDEFKNRNTKDVILLPEASDGSLFYPDLKRRKGYQLGPKGSEIYIENYFEALKKLKSMKVPYWRRPSKSSGVYGIVKGIGWKEIPKSKLLKIVVSEKEDKS